VEKSAEFKAHFWPCARGWAIGVHERTGISQVANGAKIIEARRADDFRPGIFRIPTGGDSEFRIQQILQGIAKLKMQMNCSEEKLRCEEEASQQSRAVWKCRTAEGFTSNL